jgi:hypothetical protein
VIFFKTYAKKEPIKTPKQTPTCAYEPSVPDISVGDSYLMIRGARALKKPTQNPWQSLRKIRIGKYCIYIKTPTRKANKLMSRRQFLNWVRFTFLIIWQSERSY